MTISEKILAKHAGKSSVSPGEFIEGKLDFILGNDITAPLAIEEFRNANSKKVFDKERVALVLDHFTPNKDIKSAEQCKFVRDFAKEQNLKYFFDVGCMGIEHVLLPEQGLVLPGDLIVGADSHTCTYGALGAFSTGVGSTDLAAAMATGKIWLKIPESIKFIYKGKRKKWVTGKDLILYTIGQIGVDGALYKAMEFTGEAIDELSIDSRFTMANMAIEAGAKNGIFYTDDKTVEYVKPRAKRKYEIFKSDPDAVYSQTFEYDISNMEPQVALPHLPSNAKPVSEVKNISIDQAVIGSCTNGRLEDFRIAAQILKGKKCHKDVRTIIIPGSQKVYLEILKEGLIETFIKSDAVVSTPTCGPCLGGHMGILAKGERAISTTNRNFVGRMGHIESEIYLSGPAVAAASAVKGKISHPDEI
jgi:3-isopropylmalate/(R)-2-methylmalate dehydratase large subunit